MTIVPEDLAQDYRGAANEEGKDRFAAGADRVQLDEPNVQECAEKVQRYGLKTLDGGLGSGAKS
jgi:5-methyltetrahydropteroyltriglutamate--homocysteine methyltransferase